VVRRDSEYTLNLVLDHCPRRDQQDAAIAALSFKCDVLRTMLDVIDYNRQSFP
jgi:pyrroloquinoline-quinone synthase